MKQQRSLYTSISVMLFSFLCTSNDVMPIVDAFSSPQLSSYHATTTKTTAIPATKLILSKTRIRSRSKSKSLSILQMKTTKATIDETNARRDSNLNAVAFGTANQDEPSPSSLSIFPFDSLMGFESFLLPVISTSMLITSNTVGATMLVLPEYAAGPGTTISMSIFVLSYVLNLISGFLIAQVAMTQHEQNGQDVPSSFQEFATSNLQFVPHAGMGVATISVMVNALMMAFNTDKVGHVLSSVLSSTSTDTALQASSLLSNPSTLSLGWAAMCTALVASQTMANLSKIASALVAGLFVTFGALMMAPSPEMATTAFADLSSTTGLLSSDASVWSSAATLTPIVIMSLVYQNIVPTVVKLLDYDRTKVMSSLTLGSLIPMLMYVAFTFGGGGASPGESFMTDPLLFTLFSIITIAGSSIGCVVSLSEELDSIFFKGTSAAAPTKTSSPTPSTQEDDTDNDKFTIPGVVASVAVSLGLGQLFAGNLNGALELAGAIGSPLLYGAIPVLMVLQQQQQREQSTSNQATKNNNFVESKNVLIPPSMAYALGLASTTVVGSQVWQGVSHFATGA